MEKVSKKKTIEQRLKQLRVDLGGISQLELAERIGYDRNYIGMLERGDRNPGRRFLTQLEILEKSVLTSEHPYPERQEVVLIGETEKLAESRTNVHPVHLHFRAAPLISWASAGRAKEFIDQGYDVEWLPTLCRDLHCYALTVDGDSMEPKFVKGDILFVAPTAEARNGDLVVVKTVSDEICFKLFHWNGHTKDPVKLTSLNPAYPRMDMPRQDIRFIHPVHSSLRELARKT